MNKSKTSQRRFETIKNSQFQRKSLSNSKQKNKMKNDEETDSVESDIGAARKRKVENIGSKKKNVTKTRKAFEPVILKRRNGIKTRKSPEKTGIESKSDEALDKEKGKRTEFSSPVLINFNPMMMAIERRKEQESDDDPDKKHFETPYQFLTTTPATMATATTTAATAAAAAAAATAPTTTTTTAATTTTTKKEIGRSLIGLDGESDIDTDRGSNANNNSKEMTALKSPPERSLSETKDSVSLKENVEAREKYKQIFKQFSMECQKIELDDVKEEFNSLPGDPDDRECTAFYEKNNLNKNRYSNIPCLDISRVKLSFMSNNQPGSDYIHANYVTSPFLINDKFIVTQGPKKNTIIDFWRMIWQEKSTVIVMLCQFIEDNREKCSEYFPRNQSSPMKLEKLLLTFEDSTINKSVIVTKLKLKYRDETRIITHVQWMEWPDYKVPGSSDTMLRILRKIRRKKTPPVIHCAAGVGRSGTFVATEIALMAINNHYVVPDIKQIVSRIRKNCRCAAVQTLQQYMLIRKIVLDFGSENRLTQKDSYTRYSKAYDRTFQIDALT